MAEPTSSRRRRPPGVGVDTPEFVPGLFLTDDRVVRMGVSPYRIEVLASIDGVETCWVEREVSDWDGVEVPVLRLRRLRENKQASSRTKDLAGLDERPMPDEATPERPR